MVRECTLLTWMSPAAVNYQLTNSSRTSARTVSLPTTTLIPLWSYTCPVRMLTSYLWLRRMIPLDFSSTFIIIRFYCTSFGLESTRQMWAPQTTSDTGSVCCEIRSSVSGLLMASGGFFGQSWRYGVHLGPCSRKEQGL